MKIEKKFILFDTTYNHIKYGLRINKALQFVLPNIKPRQPVPRYLKILLKVNSYCDWNILNKNPGKSDRIFLLKLSHTTSQTIRIVTSQNLHHICYKLLFKQSKGIKKLIFDEDVPSSRQQLLIQRFINRSPHLTTLKPPNYEELDYKEQVPIHFRCNNRLQNLHTQIEPGCLQKYLASLQQKLPTKAVELSFKVPKYRFENLKISENLIKNIVSLNFPGSINIPIRDEQYSSLTSLRELGATVQILKRDQVNYLSNLILLKSLQTLNLELLIQSEDDLKKFANRASLPRGLKEFFFKLTASQDLKCKGNLIGTKLLETLAGLKDLTSFYLMINNAGNSFPQQEFVETVTLAVQSEKIESFGLTWIEASDTKGISKTPIVVSIPLSCKKLIVQGPYIIQSDSKHIICPRIIELSSHTFQALKSCIDFTQVESIKLVFKSGDNKSVHKDIFQVVGKISLLRRLHFDSNLVVDKDLLYFLLDLLIGLKELRILIGNFRDWRESEEANKLLMRHPITCKIKFFSLSLGNHQFNKIGQMVTTSD